MEYKLSSEQIKLIQDNYYIWEVEGDFFTSIAHIDYINDQVANTFPQELYDAILRYQKDNEYLIYRYSTEPVENVWKHPKKLISPLQLKVNLYTDYTLFYGDRTRKTFYVGYDVEKEELNTPIIKIDYKYHRDSEHLLKYTERTISWMKASGDWGEETYEDIKPFTSYQAKLKELVLVRRNIIEESQSLAKQFGFVKGMQVIYDTFHVEVGLYENVGSSRLSTAIASTRNTAFSWMDTPTSQNPDVSVRQFLAGFFSIGVIANES